MKTKKPTSKQLEARKKFAKMAKNGTLSKLRAKTTKSKKSTGLKGSLPKGMTKIVAKNIKIQGLSKTTGRLLKGYYYDKNGKIKKSKSLIDKEKKSCKK